MKFLEPMRLMPEYFEGIEAEIKILFDKTVFEPLAAIFKKYRLEFEVQNARDPIVDAIRIGRVYLEDGYFKGSFNAAISKQFKKLGAKYSIMKRGWTFDTNPANLQIAAANANDRLQKFTQEIITSLDSIDVKRMTENSALPARYLKSTEAMNRDFEKTVKKISIKPKFTKEQAEIISEEYSENLDRYIKGWTEQNILKLREKVMSRVSAGGRAEGLAKTIETAYQVSRDKAKFLARQETSLLMSKFREERYKGIGITKYKWSGADDERERPDHKLLNNKVFRWDDPPITNRETGARNNPGEDYGCRCIAVPIVEGHND